jgi:hypothetical protein
MRLKHAFCLGNHLPDEESSYTESKNPDDRTTSLSSIGIIEMYSNNDEKESSLHRDPGTMP